MYLICDILLIVVSHVAYDAPMEIRDGDEVLTLSQAAERLGLQRGTLVRQARRGRLHATLAGSVYLVTAREVERYRAEVAGKPGPKPARKVADPG
jgi:excisionase family DNA binding protein